MKIKKWIGALTLTGALLAFAGSASAHVTVSPKEATAGGYEKYTVRVPVEKDSNTTKVRVEFPPGVKVSTVMPVPGWKYEFEKDTEGRFKALTWTTTAEGIKPHEFMEFSFSGKNPDQPGKLAWKAYQTYADNSVVEWTGAEGSDKPASVTTLKEKSNTGDNQHGEKPGAAVEPGNEKAAAPAAPAAETKQTANNTVPLILSAVALLLSIISLFRKRASK
jgi:uncharacterized protein YcnI